MTTTIKRTVKMVNCPKCDGKGYIDGLSHVANGVCFRCSGNKTVKATAVAKAPAMSESAIAACEFIMNATADQIEALTFRQISATRNTAHWNYPQYPTLRATWFDKFNDRFCELQDIAWQAMNDKIQAGWAAR